MGGVGEVEGWEWEGGRGGRGGRDMMYVCDVVRTYSVHAHMHVHVHGMYVHVWVCGVHVYMFTCVCMCLHVCAWDMKLESGVFADNH